MRICFVSRRFFPAVSGMSVYASNLLRELVAAGHEVTMVSQYRGDEEGTRVYGGGPPPRVPGVEVIGLEALGEQAGGDFEADVATIRETVLAAGRFDLVHAQYGYPTGLAAMEAARELGVPCVVSIQGGDGHWVGSCCGTHERAMRTVLDHAGALLIGSPSFRDEVIGRFGTPPERFTIIPGAVDADRFRFGPPQDRRGRLAHGSPGRRDRDRRQRGSLETSLAGDSPGVAPASDSREDTPPSARAAPPTLLYHGRVDRRKGALDLIDAIADMDTDVRVVMSGIGPDFEAARAKATALSLDAQFPGVIDYDQVPDVYTDGDLFVSPTYAEGFSNTILEAMASGLPVVAGRAVGVVDCITDGANGVLVEPGDVGGLAYALDALLADGPRRERLALQARDDVERKYAWPVVAQQIMHAYATAPARIDWASPTGPREPCRFREAPHLL